ncbi:hypothetical protein HanXRQr2_Chr15g0686661 [Helianthus annuus]|uniref:Uncharacterized protein n=1 Tax=Helianthus annuus TaxID=4232 RepID=A0A9K3H2S4_HELAN|nr:hypothetical protein HanXRQr2_Chr15g0686661 [Helianthus annuus]KAJ0830727.1 hypothetical protein HanPSC8_Chr15g0658721 [Helianthus annuus]
MLSPQIARLSGTIKRVLVFGRHVRIDLTSLWGKARPVISIPYRASGGK